jgi:hypothetical protein
MPIIPELVDQLIALVEQSAGGVADDIRVLDLRVQCVDLLNDEIDLRDTAARFADRR